MRRTTVVSAVIGAAAVGLLPVLAAPAAATQVKVFQAQSQQAFLAGTLEGVSVDPLGRLELAPRVDKVASLSEPFLLAAAAHPDGWVVGTGNAGKVLKVDRQGKVTELFAAPEPEVFAVWADQDGTVFAGTSPNGKVYRIPKGGKAEVWFEPKETYVWALARAADGALLVATGTQGKLFRVEGKGRGAVLYDGEDTHLRSLLALPGGDLLIGTAGEGLILRLSPSAKDAAKGAAIVRTLYDSQQPEVVALAAAPDGTCYAAVVASEASLVDLSKPAGAQGQPQGAAQGQAQPAPSGDAGGGEPTVTVTVEGGDAATATGTRREGAGAPRSELLRIAPAGTVETIASLATETVYSLLWQGGSLWVGTGLEGKLFRWDGAQMLLEKDVDERQVVALVAGEPGPAFATTNAAALFRVTSGREERGTYTSPPLDASQVARFGSFRWRGETPGGSAVRFSFRSGISAEPDRTWSAWTEARTGEEIALAGVPRGRFVQYRAELSAGREAASPGEAASPRLYGTELSYRQENLRPKVDSLAALDAGQILVPANFNPANQVYEPAHPSRDGIFTPLGTPADDLGSRGVKPLWKRGFRSLRWSASDPNGDDLTYALAFRAGDAGVASGAGTWLPVAEDLTDPWYSFDATVLPDGVYRFRLSATDAKANDPETALAAELVSDPVVIDHTSPRLAGVERRKEGQAGKGGFAATVTDELSPIREAVYSVDAGEWKPALAADGLLDGKREVLSLPAGDGTHLLLLRVTDAAYNVVTFDLSRQLP